MQLESNPNYVFFAAEINQENNCQRSQQPLVETRQLNPQHAMGFLENIAAVV